MTITAVHPDAPASAPAATPRAPAPPLLAAHLRPLALAVLVVAVDVLAVLGAGLHGTQDPTRFDTDVLDRGLAWTGTTTRTVLLALTDPALVVGTVAVVALAAALLRRWRVAALAVLGPGLGLVLESHVLKPWIDRRFGLAEQLSHGAIQAGDAYPSGHQTGLTSVVTVLVVLLLRSSAPRWVRALLGTLAALWVVLGGAGLVVNLYHYATDVVGGAALGVAVTLATASVVDAVAERVRPS